MIIARPLFGNGCFFGLFFFLRFAGGAQAGKLDTVRCHNKARFRHDLIFQIVQRADCNIGGGITLAAYDAVMMLRPLYFGKLKICLSVMMHAFGYHP